MKTFKRCLAYLAIVALLVISFFGSQPSYLGVQTAHATTITPGYEFHNTSWAGIRAYMSTARNFSITSSPSREIFFAHSMKAPRSCLEMVVRHDRRTAGMTKALVVYPWCGSPGPIYDQDISNATWLSKYARTWAWGNWDWPSNPATYNDETFYATIRETSSSCWSAQLYNYNTGVWDTIASRCGSASNNNGWTVIDFHDFDISPFPTCQQLGTYNTMQTRQIQKLTSIGGTFVPTVTADAYVLNAPMTSACQPILIWTFRTVGISPSGYQVPGFALCAPAYQPNCD